MNDKEIIELYNRRSEEAIAETDKAYGRYCRAVTYGILGNREDSEECMNDTYMKLWELIPPKKPPSLGAFTAKIARNLALNRREMLSRLQAAAGHGVPVTNYVMCISYAKGVFDRVMSPFRGELENL